MFTFILFSQYNYNTEIETFVDIMFNTSTSLRNQTRIKFLTIKFITFFILIRKLIRNSYGTASEHTAQRLPKTKSELALTREERIHTNCKTYIHLLSALLDGWLSLVHTAATWPAAHRLTPVTPCPVDTCHTVTNPTDPVSWSSCPHDSPTRLLDLYSNSVEIIHSPIALSSITGSSRLQPATRTWTMHYNNGTHGTTPHMGLAPWT